MVPPTRDAFWRSGLNSVAEQELLRARKFLDRRHQPHQELEVGFDCGAGLAGVVGHDLVQ
jgi:hypothetical protein